MLCKDRGREEKLGGNGMETNQFRWEMKDIFLDAAWYMNTFSINKGYYCKI
jgi:hypothetical protein